MNHVELSIIVVSYNTRELTLECLRSLYTQTDGISFEVFVVDNASSDYSAEAIAESFPQVKMIRLDENIGFARANNLAAERARGDYLLLLNPDTVILDKAIQKLLSFAHTRPENGIYGGRTLFGDGTLNPSCCWARSTPWSEFCRTIGLSTLFRRNAAFDPESLGRWPRDTIREVDIVTGCFFLIRRNLWEHMNGFDPAFFMYGEEADLCLRARAAGARPIICPDAAIIHYGGRSETNRANKLVQMLRARRLLMQRHWTSRWISFGRATQTLAVLHRLMAYHSLAHLRLRAAKNASAAFTEVWRRRREWSAHSSPPTTIATDVGQTLLTDG